LQASTAAQHRAPRPAARGQPPARGQAHSARSRPTRLALAVIVEPPL